MASSPVTMACSGHSIPSKSIAQTIPKRFTAEAARTSLTLVNRTQMTIQFRGASAICVLLLIGACERRNTSFAPSYPVEAEVSTVMNTDLGDPDSTFGPPTAIKNFCGDCHALPSAESFERDVWYREIRLGYEFYARSGRTDLTPPPLQSVLKYYRANAPARIEFPVPREVDAEWRDRFTTSKLDWKDADYVMPAISSVAWVELLKPGVSHLLVTDMRDGTLSLVDPTPQKTARTVIGRFSSPARVVSVDFDADGLRDLLVSDLGSLKPFEHQLGKVVLLRRQNESLDFESITLCDKLGRVADCAVGDFCGDEQLDLVIAEFGHRRTGSIRLLTNTTKPGAVPNFEQKTLDIRPGTIRIVPHDWNGDGQLDFAAIISQEYEAVDLFINNRHQFKNRNLFLGPDLSFGSVGLEPVDLDQDGDLDLLLVNGDCFDNNYANRSHGVSWLENIGGTNFVHHRLLDMPGAYRALAGDMDGDGDIDIVVCANLPAGVKPDSLRNSSPASIILLEQTARLEFSPHVLERGTPRYPALEIGDFNKDGKLDFVVGAQLFPGETPGSDAAKLPRLTIWWQL